MIDPVAFRIGDFAVYWYGIIIMLGVLAGGTVVAWQAKRRGLDPDHAWNLLTACLILGIVGARIYHVLTPSPSMGDPLYYWHNPWEIFNIRRGGLGIYGAIIGGALAVLMYTRRAGLDTWLWLDMAAPAVAIGQAIGRWGNFINQELYGRPTDLPWGIYIEPAYRLAGYESYERFHPTFLYESLCNFGIFLFLLIISNRKDKPLMKGETVGLYAILYSTVRFLLEFVRLDSASIGNITIAQIVALVVIVVTGAFLIYRRRQASPPEQM